MRKLSSGHIHFAHSHNWVIALKPEKFRDCRVVTTDITKIGVETIYKKILHSIVFDVQMGKG